MAIERASSQSPETLVSYYKALTESEDSVSSSMGHQMLVLLPMLSEVCAGQGVWGLTSLAHLWLLAVDDWTSPWLVSVTALPGEGFRVRYRMPEAEAPWPDSVVEGQARDEGQACQLVAIGMGRSGGWATI